MNNLDTRRLPAKSRIILNLLKNNQGICQSHSLPCYRMPLSAVECIRFQLRVYLWDLKSDKKYDVTG